MTISAGLAGWPWPFPRLNKKEVLRLRIWFMPLPPRPKQYRHGISLPTTKNVPHSNRPTTYSPLYCLLQLLLLYQYMYLLLYLPQ